MHKKSHSAVSVIFVTCILLSVIAITGCAHPNSQSTFQQIPTDTSSGCLYCEHIMNEWDAEDCVSRHLLTDAATTYNGKQLQAELADAYGYAYHGDCQQSYDGSWEVSVYFDPWVVDEVPAMDDIFTVISLCGSNNREAYDTRWLITSEGCIQPINGNAIRLLTELQH